MCNVATPSDSKYLTMNIIRNNVHKLNNKQNTKIDALVHYTIYLGAHTQAGSFKGGTERKG